MGLTATIVVVILMVVAPVVLRLGSPAASSDAERVAPAPAKTPPAPVEEDPREAVQGFIAAQVRGGFLSEAEVLELATDHARDEHSEEIIDQVPAWVRLAFEAQREAQGAWPAVTDCDRLDAAFSSLERQGIVARQNWTCCQTCGHAEIADAMEEARQSGEVRGYTFFHQQDTDSAVEGYGLWLAYGSTEDDDAATVAIGHSVCNALRDAGLSPTWEGVGSKRIALPMNWQRRLAVSD